MRIYQLPGKWLYVLCGVLLLLNTRSVQAAWSYLDNGTVRVGVDLSRGGAIGYLSLSNTSNNVVNIHDLGRYVQQSYYAGPIPFIPPGAVQHPAYAGFPWNPVQAGDVYNNCSQTLEWSNDGTTLYVKFIPKQWALSNIDSECVCEAWITLAGNTAHVRNRLTNNRADTTQYGALDQELPAIYTIGTLYRLYTYIGNQPFTQSPLTLVDGPPGLPGWTFGAHWSSTENWMALVNNQNWGLGVFLPGVYWTNGGFHGALGSGGPSSDNTGYLSPVTSEILDHNIVYEYEYTLILSSLAEIRAYAYVHRPDPIPHYVFTQDRQHFYYVNATDSGWPITGFLHVNTGQSGARIVGPLSLWQACDVPTVSVRAAFQTQSTTATLYHTAADGVYSSARKVAFAIVPGGQVRTYEINMTSDPSYSGPIGRLILVPPAPSGPANTMDLYSITAPSGGPVNHAPFVDAGADQEVAILSNPANLDGTVADEGLPNPPGQVNCTWTKQSGPGVVPFGNVHAADTTASFSTCGVYVLRLTADDSQLSAYDEVTITVPYGKAANPSPANGSSGLSTSTTLSWTAGREATAHKVYFGTSNPLTYRTEQTELTYNPGTLQNNTIYYWRIDEVNAGGTTTGTLWSFTTVVAAPGQATNPNPANGVTEVSTAADLTWTAGGGATSHKVYFGTTNPPQYKTTQTSTGYDPGLLSRQTTYYWRIDSVNAGGTTTGELWSFASKIMPADFDNDGDVDQEDFGHFQRCYGGAYIPVGTGCADADLDGDNDVDQADFTAFRKCLGGADQPPGC